MIDPTLLPSSIVGEGRGASSDVQPRLVSFLMSKNEAELFRRPQWLPSPDDYRSPEHSHFAITIPDDWTDQDLLELIFLQPREPGKQNWPAWEIPAYHFVSFKLFRFWRGEKKPDK